MKKIDKNQIDLFNQQDNQLKIIKEVDCKIYKCGKIHRMVQCICKCGVIKIFGLSIVINKRVLSCGCFTKLWAKEHIKNLNNNREYIKTGSYVKCDTCGKDIYRKRCEIKINKLNFCSRKCCSVNKDRNMKISKKSSNRKVSEDTKLKLSKIFSGKNSKLYKNGRPHCPICNKEIQYSSKHCNKHKVFTKEHREKIRKNQSLTMRGKMPKNMNRAGKFRNVVRGNFDINGKTIFLRSIWEANYALYLDLLKDRNIIEKWEYEKDVFIFDKIKRGTKSYTPDFKIYKKNNMVEYHEVKGWMTKKCFTKLKRMGIYYPSIKIILIKQKEYNNIKKEFSYFINFY